MTETVIGLREQHLDEGGGRLSSNTSVDILTPARLFWAGGKPQGLRFVMMVSQTHSAYRYYYYYGSLLARRGEAGAGCPGVTI